MLGWIAYPPCYFSDAVCTNETSADGIYFVPNTPKSTAKSGTISAILIQ
ncbi:MAG: hypothetical protein Q4E16_04250 [Neisseria sp.]|nr:hypothetical protein [Neisseria sp.]